MILADLHTHTKYSHGGNTPNEMFEAAQARGLAYMGFTEHSPRPVGFDYTHEYREQLTRQPLPLPVMEIADKRDLFAFEYEDFKLRGYKAHDKIQAPIAV